MKYLEVVCFEINVDVISQLISAHPLVIPLMDLLVKLLKRRVKAKSPISVYLLFPRRLQEQVLTVSERSSTLWSF